MSLSFISGCGAKQEGEKEPFKIGVVLSESGPNEPLGKPEKNAIQLFVDRINDQGGVNGHPLEVIIKDDQSDATKAAEMTNELISEGVLAIIGSSGTTTTLSMKTITTEAKIPLVCMSAGTSVTEKDYEWTFRTPPTDAMAAEKALKYVAEELGKKKVSILYDSNAFGTDGKRILEQLAPQYGIEIISTEAYDSKVTEEGMDTHLTNLQSRNPEVLIVWGTNPAPAIAAKRMKSKGMNIPYIGSHGIANQKFIELAGNAAEGVIFPAGKVLVWEQALDPSSEQYKLVKDFAEAYQARFNSQINTFAGHGWDAILLVTEALKRLGDQVTPEKLREALEQTRGVVGTAGTFNYSSTNHDGLTPEDLVMVKISGGKWEAIK
jgi:branched-chain amino acid transport system substrate-binding protein